MKQPTCTLDNVELFTPYKIARSTAVSFDFDLKGVIVDSHSVHVAMAARLSFRLLSRLSKRLAMHDIPSDIDGKRLERALAHATADTFRTRSIACRNTSASRSNAPSN